MGYLQRGFIVFLAFFGATGLVAQTPDYSSGDVTIQLTQGLNSATNPRGISQGQVKDSTNPSIPKDSMAMVGIAADPGGGVTVRLLQITINGRPVRVASSMAVQVRDRSTGILEFGRKGPKDAASGAYVLLPERTSVRFTLAQPPVMPVPRGPVQPAQALPIASPQLPFVKWTDKLTSPVTDDVKAACEAKDNTSQAYCYGVLMSLYDAVLVAADAQASEQPCVPEGTTPEQIRKVFLDYTAKRPTQTGGDIGIFFNLAFEEAYACPKAPAPKAKPKTRTKK